MKWERQKKLINKTDIALRYDRRLDRSPELMCLSFRFGKVVVLYALSRTYVCIG